MHYSTSNYALLVGSKKIFPLNVIKFLERKNMTTEIGGYPVVDMGATINFIQARPRIIVDHWKEKILLL